MIKLKHKISLATVLISLQLLLFTMIVYAPWQTLGTGYAITSSHHGVDVPPGTPVIVTAGTLDQSVVNITFRWHMPNDTVRWEVTKLVWNNLTYGQWNNGTSALIWYANDTQTPDVLGDWGVQAFFLDSQGRDKANLTNVVKIRATSFNAVPEIPLGTIGAAATMIIALALFALKKKKAIRTPRKF